MTKKNVIVEHFGSDSLKEIQPVVNEDAWTKPKCGGLWTSPVDSRYGWKQWCMDENYNTWLLNTSFQLEIKTENLLCINSYEDMENKMIKPGFIYLKCRTIQYVDFERISQQYDGIWLTVKGEQETRYSRPYCLYAWDCETVLLFNENPIVKEIPV